MSCIRVTLIIFKVLYQKLNNGESIVRVLLYFLLPFIIYSVKSSAESFISEYEYGQMLYENPRGVSCKECHGESGEGKIIVHYEDTHGKQELRGSDIRKHSLADMIDALNRYHKVMPRYYLTDDEIKAIYKYLQEKYKKDLKKLKNKSKEGRV
jgi:cytochrome c553